MTEILAIIPARGGSKGIPLKNIVPLSGAPLLSYNLKAARDAKKISRIVVSTDNLKISEVAKQYGAEVCLRPEGISGDFSSSEDALLHVLEKLYEDERYVPDIVVFLQCTSPLTLAEDIDGIIEKYLSEKADTALSVAPFHYYVWSEDENGEGQGINHDKMSRSMRQERKNQFLENGAIYVMETAGFLQHRFRFFGKTITYLMPEERSHEIDEPVDLLIAEAMMIQMNLK